MYPLLESADHDAHRQAWSIRQGAITALCLRRPPDQAALLDLLLLRRDDAAAPEHMLQLEGRTLHLRLHVVSSRIGLVSQSPTLLSALSIRQNLGLVAERVPTRFKTGLSDRIEAARHETGLLAGIDLGLGVRDLDWVTQVEINFLQAWLMEPEWLVFDGIFERADAARLVHLPQLFRTRFPLRGVCHVGQEAPPSEWLKVTQTIGL